MNFNNNDPRYANWFYNPQYMNPQAYREYQAQIQAYEQQQSREVVDAAHKFQEFLDSKNKLDSQHQQELYCVCLALMFKEMKWNK